LGDSVFIGKLQWNEQKVKIKSLGSSAQDKVSMLLLTLTTLIQYAKQGLTQPQGEVRRSYPSQGTAPPQTAQR